MPIPFKDRSRQLVRKIIIDFKHKINANPRAKEAILLLFEPFPRFKARIKGIEALTSDAYKKMYYFDGPGQLPPQAQKIYVELIKSIEKRKEGKR